MKRKDIILIISKYIGRYPTVVEINYFGHTGTAKKVEYFTQEEHKMYNPSPRILEQVHKLACNILYVWHNHDKIKTKIEKEKLKAIRDARMEAREKELHRRWEEAKMKSLRESKTYVSNRGTPASERALRKQIAADNKRRIRDILKFHEVNNVAIPEEMWDIIIKYR